MYIINRIKLPVLLLLLTYGISSCDDESGITREVLPETSSIPTIEITTSINDGVIGGVAGASAAVTLHVTSDVGLQAILMNSQEVAKLPTGQLDATYTHSITIPPSAEPGETFLDAVFTVVDEFGQTQSTEPIEVQRFPLPDNFVITSLSGTEMSRDDTPLPSANNSIPRVQIGVEGDLGLGYSYVHLVFNDNLMDTFMKFGVAPEATPDKTALAWIRNNDGKYKGWNSFQVDLDTYIPEELINDVMNGDRVIKADVYYEKPESEPDDLKAFASILNLSNYESYNRGSKSGILLEYTDTLTAANEWQTLVYDEVPPNDWASENTTEDPATSEIDMLDISISRGYKTPDGATYYIRNIRLETVE